MTTADNGRIFLIRHGQTTSNVRRALDTKLPGADLTELGIEQARQAGELLKSMTGELVLASSEAARAQQTARYLAEAFRAAGGDVREHGAVANIQEIPAGEMEMTTDEDSHYEYHVTFGSWLMGDLQRTIPGGLNGQQVLERYLPALFDFLDSVPADRSAAVVSHGAVIRFVAAFLCDLDANFAFTHYLANTQWVELVAPSAERLASLRELAYAGDIAGLKGCLEVTEWAGEAVHST